MHRVTATPFPLSADCSTTFVCSTRTTIAALSRFMDPAGGLGGTPTLIVDGAKARNIGISASAIQEIGINQNPYTAEYPRWSRRRIEVITKTATDKYHGTVMCSSEIITSTHEMLLR